MSTLQASLQITLTQNTSQYSYGNGGEFRASGTVISGVNPSLAGYNKSSSDNTAGTVSGNAYFQTFCIETSEYFSPGVTYNVTVSDRAMYGSQPPNGDPLSIGTAWLYSQFAAGTLSTYNYTYGAGRVADAGDLQKAIWWLEGESGGVKNSFITLAEGALGKNDTTIKYDANGAYGVVVLNLWDVNTGAADQDQLMVVPEPTTVIAALLLALPFGVSTVRVLGRKQTA